MDPVRTTTIVAALDTMASRADELASVTFPKLAGGVSDRGPAQALVNRALSDAERAAQLVAGGELGGEAQRAARQAVTLLEHAVIDEIALRATASGLRRSIDTIRSSPRLLGLENGDIAGTNPTEAAEIIHALMMRPMDQLAPGDWSRIASILEHDASAALPFITHKIHGSPPLAQQARDIAAGSSRPSHHTELYFQQYQIAQLPPQRRTAIADELLRDRDPSTVSRGEWNYLAALAEANPDAAWSRMPGQLTFAQHARELAAGTVRPSRLTLAYFDRYSPNSAGKRDLKKELALLRTQLASQTVIANELAQLHRQTVTLIDRNLARLNGRTPPDAVRGYGRHPDYAEIGRIFATAQLFDELSRGARVGAGTEATRDAATATARPATGDVLTW